MYRQCTICIEVGYLILLSEFYYLNSIISIQAMNPALNGIDFFQKYGFQKWTFLLERAI
jgi:hypothetical protein